MILAIDPGNEQSGWVVIDDDLRPVKFGKTGNEELLQIIKTQKMRVDAVCIEMMQNHGHLVGNHVLWSCVWIGRFTEVATCPVHYVYRHEEKLHVCGKAAASDTDIRHALIQRFAKHDRKTGKGTKTNPDWFFGFAADIWQAYAVAITYAETKGAKSGMYAALRGLQSASGTRRR